MIFIYNFHIMSIMYHYLKSLNFLKYFCTVSFLYGFVARHVAMFSGCSIHNLWPIASFSKVFDSSFKADSSFA